MLEQNNVGIIENWPGIHCRGLFDACVRGVGLTNFSFQALVAVGSA
jgi:hypothetical protein